jgi:hypothetical protein
MSTPDTEIALLLNQITNNINNIVQSILDEIVRGRASGALDSAIAKNILDQLEIPRSNIASSIRAIGFNTTNTMRKIYGQTEMRLSTGLNLTQDITAILPENLGFIPKPGDTIRLGIDNDYVRRSDERRAQRAQQRLTDEQTLIEQGAQRERLMWQARFVNTCPDCVQLSGQIKTFQEWQRTGGLPRQRNTICNGSCQCSLVPVSTLKQIHDLKGSDREVSEQLREKYKEGIQVQKNKIKQLEKIRGKKYAKSTQETLIGQANQPKFGKEQTMIERSDEKIPKDFGKKYWKSSKKFDDYMEKKNRQAKK